MMHVETGRDIIKKSLCPLTICDPFHSSLLSGFPPSPEDGLQDVECARRSMDFGFKFVGDRITMLMKAKTHPILEAIEVT